ncbi:quinol dehydrogenase ferredoxin subunit NapH [Azospirillum sp.]|uniref:quinol dehydrogenase ferredoxin subunit NapH n=1 Tax=Azospirillum sp. TaxID=34012 RepID=UPI003D726AC1
MSARRLPGPAAIRAKGWFRAHRWLLARRAVQLGFLALFLSGPLLGVWIAKGTLATSLTLGVLPLSDPFIVLQSLVARHAPETAALLGALIVLAAYALLRGRLFCSWVCPVNVVTDGAAALRRRLGWREGVRLDRRLRLVVLAGALLASAVGGSIAWELVNPITMTHRALVFGSSLAWGVVAAVFLFDLAVAPRGWCGALCPVGAFYGLIGRWGRVRVGAPQRAACDHCQDCFQVCPEPHVITPSLKDPDSDLILSRDCTACGRCVDVCPQSVFVLGVGRQGPVAGAAPLRQGDLP